VTNNYELQKIPYQFQELWPKVAMLIRKKQIQEKMNETNSFILCDTVRYQNERYFINQLKFVS